MYISTTKKEKIYKEKREDLQREKRKRDLRKI
jgi:hypothetical protein